MPLWESDKLLTIIICTRNRVELLEECLQSLLEQTAGVEEFDVLVVDNDSDDGTEAMTRALMSKQPHFHYVSEPLIGLSHARNRGYSSCPTLWLTYLDDDAKAHNDFVQKILETIATGDFDCFGGVYLPWYKYGKPSWLSDNYVTNVQTQMHYGELPDDRFASGGNLTMKTPLLAEIGGFNPSYGMAGSRISYWRGECDADGIEEEGL